MTEFEIQKEMIAQSNDSFLIYSNVKKYDNILNALSAFINDYDLKDLKIKLICELTEKAVIAAALKSNNRLVIIADDDIQTQTQKENELKQVKADYCFCFDDWQNETFVNLICHTDYFKTICETKSDTDYIMNYNQILNADLQRKKIITGFSSIDKYLNGGFDNGQLYVVGGDPAAGKTAFCQNIAIETMRQNNDVIYFSLEMSRKELTARALCYLSRLNNNPNEFLTFKDIFAKSKSAALQTTINKYLLQYQNIAAYHLKIVESVFDFTAERIRNTVYNYIHNTGRQPLIIIDYFQLLQPSNDYQTDKQAADYNIKELKKIARDFDIPILCICSLNRSNYQNKDKDKNNNLTVSLQALKESGSLEYTASVIMFLNNLDTQNNNNFDYRKIAVTIPKNRNGYAVTNDSLQFYFYMRNYCFSEYAL